MLSQLSHSAKHLEKIKKNKNRLGGSGFEFLLQSMDRDKENQMPNAHPINYGQLSQSVNVESQVTVPFSLLQKHEGRQHQPPFIDNVKILDCSDLSISQVSEHTQKPKKKHLKVCPKQFFQSKEVEIEKQDTMV